MKRTYMTTVYYRGEPPSQVGIEYLENFYQVQIAHTDSGSHDARALNVYSSARPKTVSKYIAHALGLDVLEIAGSK